MTWYNPKKTNEIPAVCRQERTAIEEQLRRICLPAPEPRYADDQIPEITYHQAHGLSEEE